MKPSVQKIINKLPKEKVNLATQKIDLAIADNLAKIVNEAKEGIKTLDKIQKRQEQNNGQMIQDITLVVKKGNAEDDKINSVIDKLEKLGC